MDNANPQLGIDIVTIFIKFRRSILNEHSSF